MIDRVCELVQTTTSNNAYQMANIYSMTQYIHNRKDTLVICNIIPVNTALQPLFGVGGPLPCRHCVSPTQIECLHAACRYTL